MKVLLSLYACLPDAGSEAGGGWNSVIQYAQADFEVWGITRVENRESIEARLKKLRLTNVRFHYTELSAWKTSICDSGEAGMYLHYYWWQQQVARDAKKLDRQENFDLVHHISYASLQQGTGLWRLGKKLIYGPVGGGQFTPDVFRKYFYRDWFKYEIVRRWISALLTLHPNVRRTLREAALVYTTNDETYALAKKLGGKNVRNFNDSGLPADFYPKQYPERTVTQTLQLLWVGRLFARKGLPLVLEALAKVDPAVDFHLTIVGDGPLLGQVPEWVVEYGLQGKVTSTGRLPWMQVREMYRKSDVFMFCSLRDSSAVQYIEAMAWGLPVITLDIHGGRVTVPGNAGIKVAVEDKTLDAIISDLARAVEKMHTGRHQLREIGLAAYEHAKSYSWTNRMRIHTEKLRQVLDGAHVEA